jgi:hypothetical protein
MCHGPHHHHHHPRATSAPRATEDAPHMRVSDADRERTVESLRGHAGAGRLDADELEERIGAAFAARTRADLAKLTHDLPEPRRVSPRTPHQDGPPPFVPIALLLVAIWAVTGAGYFWPIWPLMFFAFAGIAHAARRSGNTRVISNSRVIR